MISDDNTPFADKYFDKAFWLLIGFVIGIVVALLIQEVANYKPEYQRRVDAYEYCVSREILPDNCLVIVGETTP